MSQIIIELPLLQELVADLEFLAQADHRTLHDFIALLLRRHAYGDVALLPDAIRDAPIVRYGRERVTKQLRAGAYKRTGGTCYYCHMQLDPFYGWDCDHVIPVSRGGRSHASNLVAACDSCNASKRDMDADEFKASISNKSQ